MSTLLTTKLKSNENILIECGKLSEFKENDGLLKQIQNMKINKYARYFDNRKGNIKTFEQALAKFKDRKKGLNIPSGKDLKINEIENAPVNCKLTANSKNDNSYKVDSQQSSTMVIELENNKILHERGNSDYENNFDLNLEKDPEILKLPIKNRSKNLNNYLNSNLQNSNKSIVDSTNKLYLNNPQFTSDYLLEIYYNLLEEESLMISLSGYMLKQDDINEKMRAILIDWIINVHLKFKLTEETLFLTVNLIDRYLYEKVVKREQLQLIGVSALLIACKYEEIYSPELKDFEYITDKSFKKEDIIKLEMEMLKLVGFQITVPSAYRFFEIISLVLSFDPQEVSMGKYLLEMFLIDYRYTKYLPSQIACSICFLVIQILENKNSKNPNIPHLLSVFLDIYEERGLFSYEKVLKECCQDICFLFENIESTQLITVKKKYMSLENHKVAKFNYSI